MKCRSRNKAWLGAAITAAAQIAGAGINYFQQQKANKKQLQQQYMSDILEMQNNIGENANNDLNNYYDRVELIPQFPYGGNSNLKPNIVRGGRAIDLGNNLYLMKGRKHNQGGIDIGSNPKTGIEVEGNEVVQTTPSSLRVFSAQPILGGISPAEYILGGVNPNKVFAAQENWKRINRIADDGTKYITGGKIDKRNFKTVLNKKNEAKFQNWYKNVSSILNIDSDPDNPFHAYDYRGYWLENRNKDIDYTQPDFHFTDKYKQPTHETFSIESQYAKKKYGINPESVGHWDNETFIPGKFNDLMSINRIRNNNDANNNSEYIPSENIINYIKSTEGFRDKWYQDSKGIWTVGYGFTGSKVRKMFPNGMTREQADKYLADSLNVRKQILQRDTPNWNSLNQNQRDALLSYHYNIGEGNYRDKSPKMQQALKDKNWDIVSKNIDAGYNDKRNPGLRKRRDYERNLFNTPVEFKYGGIHIKPSKRGTFTAAAKKHGMGVQAFASKVLANKDNYSPAMVKKANFARNASKWNHKKFGGDMTYSYILGKNNIYRLGGPISVTPITEKRDNTSTRYIKDINPVKVSKQDKSNLRYDDGIQGYLPIVGDVLQGVQGIKDIKDKKYASGILSLGLLAVPNVLEKSAKGVGKIVKKSISNKRVYDPHNVSKEILEKVKNDDILRAQYIKEERKYQDIKNKLYNEISGVDFDKMSIDDLYKYDELQKRADNLFNESMIYEYSPNPDKEAMLYHELYGVEKELDELKNIYKLPQNKAKADIIMHYDDLPFKYGGKVKYRRKAPNGLGIYFPTTQDLHKDILYDRDGNPLFDTEINPSSVVADRVNKTPDLTSVNKEIDDYINNLNLDSNINIPDTNLNLDTDLKVNPMKYRKRNGIIGSDEIGLGINLLGNLASSLINNKTINSLDYGNAPTPLRAVKLKTKYNINPQLDNIREEVARGENDVTQNTASSKTALSRRQSLRGRGLQYANQLEGQKENIETELINRDRFNQQQVGNRNIERFDNWYRGLVDFENNRRNLRAENAVAGINNAADAIAGPQGYIAHRERRLDNDMKLNRDLLDLKVFSLLNPNAKGVLDPEIKKAFDEYERLLRRRRGTII